MTEKVERNPIVKKTGSSVLQSILLLMGLLFVTTAYGEVSVMAVVDRNTVALHGTFTLQIVVSSDQSVSVSPPKMGTLNNTQLLHQWVSSQSKSSVVSTGQGVDFKTVKTKNFNYQFSALKKGKLKINSVAVTVGGKSYSTKPITLDVVDGAVAQAAPQRPRRQQRQQRRDPLNPMDQLEERFNQLLNRQFGGGGASGFMTEPRNAKEAFFILAEVDKTEAYKGEQVVATWYLYTRGRVRDIDTLKYPTLKGFWKEDIQNINFAQL